MYVVCFPVILPKQRGNLDGRARTCDLMVPNHAFFHLNYIQMNGPNGTRTRNILRDRQVISPLIYRAIWLAPRPGFEPGNHRFKAGGLTAWLTGNIYCGQRDSNPQDPDFESRMSAELHHVRKNSRYVENWPAALNHLATFPI